jgi:uncharacterized protein YodC (DUF2158 family)
MEKKDVKIGDVVMLNSEKMAEASEAVYMTVTANYDRVPEVDCSWFAGRCVMSESFPPEALRKVPIID